jgi:hypothetical protein
MAVWELRQKKLSYFTEVKTKEALINHINVLRFGKKMGSYAFNNMFIIITDTNTRANFSRT